LVTRVRVPLPKPGPRATYVKLRQRASIDFPLLSIAVAGDFEGDVVQDLRIVVSALGSRTRQLSGLEKIVAGQRLTDEVVDAVAAGSEERRVRREGGRERARHGLV